VAAPQRRDPCREPQQLFAVSDEGATMVATVLAPADKAGVGALPLVPRNPLPIRQQLTALRVFHTGSGCATQAVR
jgi:hypothetical protein